MDAQKGNTATGAGGVRIRGRVFAAFERGENTAAPSSAWDNARADEV